MTQQKHLKNLVRSRMAKTGERYATARRQILARLEDSPRAAGFPWHCAGNVPAATGLRILLRHAARENPGPLGDLSEAMVFGLAGGIGIGCFSFFYEKENFASFFVAGRRLWHDDLAYLEQACQRLGVRTTVRESSAAKAAAALRDALAQGPVIAWVDMANLPHRAMPERFSGGGYHVVVVHELDEAGGAALIGDLTDEPIRIPLDDLTAARGRIAKQKHRLLSVAGSPTSLDLAQQVRRALKACHDGLLGEGGVRSSAKNFSLEAVREWGERLHDSRDKQSWERVFTPGPRLWNGLTMMHDFIEHYGTGGGLCRPLFADFLREAGQTLGDARLAELADLYAGLGRQWSELADAALPDDVPAFKEAKDLAARKAELLHDGADPAEVAAVWQRLAALAGAAADRFPLTPAAADDLRAQLKARVLAIHQSERQALATMAALT